MFDVLERQSAVISPDGNSVEVCRVLLDRPRDGDAHALIYVAESPTRPVAKPIASSLPFQPDVDVTAHRRALAELTARLTADGWQPEPESRRKRLVGLTFYRRRG